MPDAPENAAEEAAEAEVAAGIDPRERVVEQVGIAVVALAVVGRLDEGVGGEEAPDGRVVDPAVEVDQADAVHLLLAGEAAGEHAYQREGRQGIEAAGVAPLAPGV